MRWKVGGIESRYRLDAAAARQDIGPSRRHVVADRRDNSKTRNDDASFAQYQLLILD
jgi:hypothetical protein